MFSIYISFINCVSKQANWNLVKLFFLPLIFSVFWLRCRRLNQAVRNQTAQLNGAGWNATCPQLLAIYYFPIYLFIAIVATWVFVRVPTAYDKVVLFVFFTYNTYVNIWAVSPQLMATKEMCFPPLPNQMLKIWFTAFINGITLRPAQSIHTNQGILVNLILSLTPPQIFLGAHLISVRGLMANCSPRARAYAQVRMRWE